MNPLGQERNSVGKFFSAYAQSWDAIYGGKRNIFLRLVDGAFRRDIYERYELTFDRLGHDLAEKKILDIGCGSGVYCFEAARRGAAKVVGVDVADDMIELANQRNQIQGYVATCEFICAEFPGQEAGKALQETFDHVILMGVMDYVADPVSLLTAARHLAKESVIVSFPGKHWLRAPVRSYRYRLLGRPNVYTYDEKSLRLACEESGFTEIDVKRIPHSGICYVVTAHA